MTSATVTQLGEMIVGVNNNTGNMDTQTGEFAGIFQTAADKNGEAVKQDVETVKPSATEKNMNVSKTADKLRETKLTEETEEPKDLETVEKEIESAVETLKEEIAEKLDITVEELEAVMETLGLNNASLLTQEGMTALVMEVEQITTPVELITNADAYQTLQDLNAMVSEVMNQVQSDLNLTDEQMKATLEQLTKPEVVTSDIPVAEGENQNQNIEVNDNFVADGEENVETKQQTADKEAVAEAENTIAEEVNTVSKEAILDGNESNAGNKGNEQPESRGQQVVAENHFQLNNTQTVNQTTTDFSQTITGGNLSTQEIYDQIGEYIKTNVRPGISEVEMQLNPENLGTVHIHLSSKQGNVTAQVTVQNELVKAAMEVQMIQLKENFAEQGIKVDAVEVTVESHAFNQNMQQSSEENAEAQAEAKRPTTRRINLNESWAEEELTEEEQLVAEMMEANGNTVDYMA